MSVIITALTRLARAAAFSLVLALLTLGLTHIASATIYYVSTTGSQLNSGLSWSAPKSDLQATIHAAVSGDQVWVKSGTYTGNFTATDGVAVYGHFAGTETSVTQRQLTNTAYATILDGNNSGTVYTISSSATRANIFDGFTVQHGNTGSGSGVLDPSRDTLSIANCSFTGNSATGYGNSIDCNDTVTVTNCTFVSNTTTNYGGSIVVNGTITLNGCTFTTNAGGGIDVNGTTTVNNCTFSGNSVTNDGGGISAVGTSLTVKGCTFTNNTASSGGGIYSDCSTTTINTQCTFTGNSGSTNGGAISLGSSTVASVSTCVFTGNHSSGGGGDIIAQGVPTIADCLFDSTNSMNADDVIFLDGVGTSSTYAQVKDCLIVGRGTTSTDPDGIDLDTGSPSNTSYVIFANDTIVNTDIGINIASDNGNARVGNTIFDGNNGGLNDNGNPGPAFTSSHNDLYGSLSYNYNGVNNSATDLFDNPMFVNTASGDYQLASTSPLINVGDDSYVTNGDKDLAGNPRIYGSHVDIGAYEYTPSGTPIPASLAFNPASVASGAQTTATVTLTLPAPTGGAVVTLTSNNTSAAPVPASVTVAAGATTATFKITAGTVTASTNVTITARYNGTSITGTLTVAPEGIASVTLSSYTITGGDALTGSVNLLYPAAVNTVVTLAPGGSDSVPASVTVKANTTSATFTIKTSAVPAKIGASVLATLNGKSVKGGFTLLPPQVSTLVIAPNAVMGGTPVSATVVLNVPAPSGGIVVTLTSSNTSEVSVPASVTVPAGSYVATFPVTTYAVTGYTRVTIDSTTTALVGAASVTLLP